MGVKQWAFHRRDEAPIAGSKKALQSVVVKTAA